MTWGDWVIAGLVWLCVGATTMALAGMGLFLLLVGPSFDVRVFALFMLVGAVCSATALFRFHLITTAKREWGK